MAERTDLLEVACAKFVRAGRVNVELIAQQGPEMPMTVLLCVLAGDCQRKLVAKISNPCGVHYPQLPCRIMTG